MRRNTSTSQLKDQLTIFSNPLFWLLGLAILCSGGAHVGYCFFIPKIGTHVLQITAGNASLLISVLGVSNIVGRLFAGWLSDRLVDTSTFNPDEKRPKENGQYLLVILVPTA